MDRVTRSFTKGNRRLAGRTHRNSGRFFSILLLTIFLATGCAGTKPEPPKEDFLEKWRTAARDSSGHSPAPVEPLEEKEGAAEQQPPPLSKVNEEILPKPQKPLPTQKVSLRMHNADLVVVLRTLARAVNQNIVMNEKVKGTVSIEMEAVPWNEAFQGILRTQGLTYEWEGDLLRVMSIEDMETDLKMTTILDKQKAQKLESRQAEPLTLQVIPISYADAPKLQEKLKEYLTKDEKGTARGSISVDEHTNSLVINGIRDDIVRLTALVKELDKPTPQILIESTIVEAKKDTARGLGVQWGGVYNDGDLFLTPGGTNGATSGGQQTYDPATGTTGISGQGFGVNFPIDIITGGGGAAMGLMFGKIGGNILDMQLLMLQNEGKLNILSSPSIITLDNQTAFTENGAKVPYVSTSGLSGTEVKFEEVVLRLEIKPHVIYGDILKMEITVKKDEVDPTRAVQGNPFIIKKQTKTTLIAKDGETIVISGLTKDTHNEAEKGIPGMKDSPLLGWLFGSKEKSNEMEEVLIFITPHILPDYNEKSPGQRAQAVKPPRAPWKTEDSFDRNSKR
jgi:type IV pilus assembly protein PilQ